MPPQLAGLRRASELGVNLHEAGVVVPDAAVQVVVDGGFLPEESLGFRPQDVGVAPVEWLANSMRISVSLSLPGF